MAPKAQARREEEPQRATRAIAPAPVDGSRHAASTLGPPAQRGRAYCVRHPTCFSEGDSSVHRLVMYACSFASKVPPRSINAASALSRKYGCVDDGTQEIRTPEDPTVTSRSESSHSSHSNVPLSRT